tara:strand:- start:3556 stop:5070 length:1515 start_codon:yes stop_codon:yes gene_type:complete
MFAGLKNIADYITDPDFVAGIARGVTETIDKGEDRRNKTLDQLRTYGLEKTNRIEQEYINDLDANEAQVKSLAASLTPDGVSANSQEVLSAAQYLIETKTLAGAQAEAKRLYDQNKRFGISQLSEINATAAANGTNLSFRNIAGGITRKPTPVNLTDSGIPVKPTFLDRVFGGPTVEDEAQQSIAALETVMDDPDEALPFIASTGYDADLIIRTDDPFRVEVKRFQGLMKDAVAQTETPDDLSKDQRIQHIASKIAILQREDTRKQTGEAEEFSRTDFNGYANMITSAVASTYKLQTTGSTMLGDRIRIEDTIDGAFELEMEINKAVTILAKMQNSGNDEMMQEAGFLIQSFLENKGYETSNKLVPIGTEQTGFEQEDFGILTFGRADGNILDEELFKKLTKTKDDDASDDTTSDDGNNNDDDGSDAGAYIPSNSTISNKKSTTLNTTSQSVTDSVAAFKNLPPSVGGLQRNKARRAVVQAIIAANPGTSPKVAREQADILLDS